MRNTILFLLLVIVFLTSLVFALILLYSSPDNIVHTKEASYFIFAGSLGVGAIFYNSNLNLESDYIIKIIYAISAFFSISSTINLSSTEYPVHNFTRFFIGNGTFLQD